MSLLLFQVYITIKGTKGKLPKQHLSKTNKNNKKVKLKFLRGSTHKFKLSGKDIGDVTSMNIEVCY